MHMSSVLVTFMDTKVDKINYVHVHRLYCIKYVLHVPVCYLIITIVIDNYKTQIIYYSITNHIAIAQQMPQTSMGT